MAPEVVVATPGVPRPEKSALADLDECLVYIRFDDPFLNCPQRENHASVVGILIENNKQWLTLLGRQGQEQKTELLPCGHQVSVVCSNYGGTLKIKDIEVRRWKTEEEPYNESVLFG